MSAAARPAGNVVVISPDDGHQPGAVAPTGPESRLFCHRTAIIIQHRHGHANAADLSSDEDRTKAFGRIGAAFSVGYIAGPLLGGALGSQSVELPFFAAAALTCCNLAYGLAFVPESLSKDSRVPFSLSRSNPFNALLRLATRPETGRLCLAFGVLTFAQLITQTAFPLYTILRCSWTPQAHFSLGTGVGGGICFEGRVLRDRELGHLLVHPDGLPCSCGRRGCLQSYASARALEDLRRKYGIDEGTNRWVAGASRALAACSANLIMLFGVTYVTLSGALAYGFPALPTMIGAALRTTYLENGDRLPDVRLSPHGDNASLQGAPALSGAGDVALTEICIPWSGE